MNGTDKYGHWWIEIGAKESYGWWPSNLGEGFLTRFRNTVFGVPGELNGQESFSAYGGSPTSDPHQGEYGGAKVYDVYAESGALSAKVIDQVRNFAHSYSGNWSWPLGQNCHSFQESMLHDLNLTIKPVQ